MRYPRILLAVTAIALLAVLAADPGVAPNDSVATPLARLVFTRDYIPGTRDANGQFMGGTEAMWLCGAWVERPGSPDPPNNGSCYLIRHRDGRYDWGTIYDAAHPVPAGQKLTGCRDIEPSPFPGEQGRVFYFCGYDGGAGPSHSTAWIYRGELAPRQPERDPQ